MRIAVVVLVCASLVSVSTGAEACAPYSFKDARGEGQVRGSDGRWRLLTLEVRGQWLRYEYADPRAPWGRLVLVGEIVDGKGWVFPLATKGRQIAPEARVIWQTTLGDGLVEFGLPVAMVSGLEYFWPYPGRPDATGSANGIPCAFPRVSLDGGPNPDICLHDSGMPVFANDARGQRVFELKSITLGEIHPSRFNRSPLFPVTARRPKYLGGFTCGGGRPVPPP